MFRRRTRRHNMWALVTDRHPCIVLIELVRPPRQGGRRKREPGASPGLPRSGEWERKPSRSTGRQRPGKRRPVGADRPVPVSPKTCQLARPHRVAARVRGPEGGRAATRATGASRRVRTRARGRRPSRGVKAVTSSDRTVVRVRRRFPPRRCGSASATAPPRPSTSNKIVRAVERCAAGLTEVDPLRVATKTISGLYDGATTAELDRLSIQTAAELIGEEPQYSQAGRAPARRATSTRRSAARASHSFSQSHRAGPRARG